MALTSAMPMEGVQTWHPPPTQPMDPIAPTHTQLAEPLTRRPRRSIAHAFDDPRSLQADQAVRDRVRQIASAHPHYGFPSAVSFNIEAPDVRQYVTHEGHNASSATYWSFHEAEHGGRTDVREILAAVYRAAQCMSNTPSKEGDSDDVRNFVREMFRLHDLMQSDRTNMTECLVVWWADKMGLVADYMHAVVRAEGACHGLRSTENYKSNPRELVTLRDRFDAVMERVVSWPKYMKAERPLKGHLVDCFAASAQDIQVLRDALTQPLNPAGTPSWPQFQPGHTKYGDRIAGDAERPSYLEETIKYLPEIRVPRAAANIDDEGIANAQSANISQETDWAATLEQTAKLEKMLRGVMQQYFNLRALLAPSTQPKKKKKTAEHISFMESYADIIGLNEAHTNPKSILIFKCAWLVIALSDTLWDVILRHERRGHVHDDEWATEYRGELEGRLVEMTRLAVLTQIEAGRETVRYLRLGQKQGARYWVEIAKKKGKPETEERAIEAVRFCPWEDCAGYWPLRGAMGEGMWRAHLWNKHQCEDVEVERSAGEWRWVGWALVDE